MNRYDSYRDTGLEWVKYVPKDWECLKIKRVYELVTEKSIPNKNDKKISPECVTSFFGTITNFHSKHGEVGVKFIENDVLFNKLGVKVHKLFHSTFEGYSMGEMIVLRSKKNTISKFLYYQLTRNEFIEYCDKISEGVTLKRVGVNDILDHYITNPPTSEQQQIVSFLDTKTSLIDSLIEKTQQKIELLKEKRTSLINEVVTKGLNPNVEMKDSGVEWIGKIPTHWELKQLKHIIKTLNSGTSVNSEDTPVTNLDEYGVLKTSCVFGDTFRPNENKKVVIEEYDRVKCPVLKDSIIFSRMNTPDLVGSNGYVDTDYDNLFLPDRLWITEFIEDIKLSVKWLSFVTISRRFRSELSSRSTGTSPSMKNITKDDLLTIKIPYPSFLEQKQIVEYLDEQTQLIDNTISLEEKRIELLKEYRQSLISEVVTGKRKVI